MESEKGFEGRQDLQLGSEGLENEKGGKGEWGHFWVLVSHSQREPGIEARRAGILIKHGP